MVKIDYSKLSKIKDSVLKFESSEFTDFLKSLKPKPKFFKDDYNGDVDAWYIRFPSSLSRDKFADLESEVGDKFNELGLESTYDYDFDSSVKEIVLIPLE